jgi:hypothetical protein
VTTLDEQIKRFPLLPDEAAVATKVTEAITGLSGRTIRYHPGLRRVWLSKSRYGQRAGDVRKLLREGYRR